MMRKFIQSAAACRWIQPPRNSRLMAHALLVVEAGLLSGVLLATGGDKVDGRGSARVFLLSNDAHRLHRTAARATRRVGRNVLRFEIAQPT